MADEKLSDDEIRELWAEHYPKRLDDLKSKGLCLAFCMMVEQRAGRGATEDEDLIFNVHEILAALGIPREEFYQMEKETGEE